MEYSLDVSAENSVGWHRLIAAIVTVVLIFLVVAGVIVGTIYSETKRRRVHQSTELQFLESSTLEQQPSPPEIAVPATGPSTTSTPPLTMSTSTQLSIPFESGPTTSLTTSRSQSRVPTPIDEVDDPLAHAGASVVPPTLAHIRSPSTQQPVNAVDEYVTIFSSFQQRGLQRSRRPMRLELADDTLPRYVEPSSYHTADPFSARI